MNIARSLTIAGSDSGGCAGIQADLKTFGALRTHGMSVITSVTAQDTRRVHRVDDLPAESVEAQIRAVVEDIGVDAVKTGMLSNRPIIETVARLAREYAWDKLVVDPVMISSGGDPLIRPQAVRVLKQDLLPRALLVTPNLAEAEALSGIAVSSRKRLQEAAEAILEMGPKAVLIKGGHGDGSLSVDWHFWDGGSRQYSAPRVNTPNTHGSGCTLSAAVTALLARGLDLPQALQEAKNYVTRALRRSLDVGRGRGPLGHFQALDEAPDQ
ncbi:MAG TPA: bifunctional hydroxymethylpyrimidine kinase/phosphomethylpyrimidine kinase [Acidobacteriota bacterium]|nr:bifunctional hydroxymethylpyrimidine kinase/phosphomethylpyrimidine kinase [Acidobacteriota bacterium]